MAAGGKGGLKTTLLGTNFSLPGPSRSEVNGHCGARGSTPASRVYAQRRCLGFAMRAVLDLSQMFRFILSVSICYVGYKKGTPARNFR